MTVATLQTVIENTWEISNIERSREKGLDRKVRDTKKMDKTETQTKKNEDTNGKRRKEERLTYFTSLFNCFLQSRHETSPNISSQCEQGRVTAKRKERRQAKWKTRKEPVRAGTNRTFAHFPDTWKCMAAQGPKPTKSRNESKALCIALQLDICYMLAKKMCTDLKRNDVW